MRHQRRHIRHSRRLPLIPAEKVIRHKLTRRIEMKERRYVLTDLSEYRPVRFSF